MDLEHVLDDLLADLGPENVGPGDLDSADPGDDVRAGAGTRHAGEGAGRVRARAEEVRERVAASQVAASAKQAGRGVRERSRLLGVRARLRSAALYGSAAWGAVLGGSAVAVSTIGSGLNPWDILAAGLGVVALPALPIGVWAYRTRPRDRAQHRQERARRRAREERTALPADVGRDWKRLRQAQALVSDLAVEGLVDPGALPELGATAEQLRMLLIADQRAAALNGTPSGPLRQQLGDLVDLLVALAVEAIAHRADEVGEASGPATLREATDRLQTLRVARAEVERVSEEGSGRAPVPAHTQDVEARGADTDGLRRGTGPAPTPDGGAVGPAADVAEDGDDQQPRPMPG